MCDDLKIFIETLESPNQMIDIPIVFSCNDDMSYNLFDDQMNLIIYNGENLNNFQIYKLKIRKIHCENSDLLSKVYDNNFEIQSHIYELTNGKGNGYFLYSTMPFCKGKLNNIVINLDNNFTRLMFLDQTSIFRNNMNIVSVSLYLNQLDMLFKYISNIHDDVIKLPLLNEPKYSAINEFDRHITNFLSLGLDLGNIDDNETKAKKIFLFLRNVSEDKKIQRDKYLKDCIDNFIEFSEYLYIIIENIDKYVSALIISSFNNCLKNLPKFVNGLKDLLQNGRKNKSIYEYIMKQIKDIICLKYYMMNSIHLYGLNTNIHLNIIGYYLYNILVMDGKTRYFPFSIKTIFSNNFYDVPEDVINLIKQKTQDNLKDMIMVDTLVFTHENRRISGCVESCIYNYLNYILFDKHTGTIKCDTIGNDLEIKKFYEKNYSRVNPNDICYNINVFNEFVKLIVNITDKNYPVEYVNENYEINASFKNMIIVIRYLFQIINDEFDNDIIKFSQYFIFKFKLKYCVFELKDNDKVIIDDIITIKMYENRHCQCNTKLLVEKISSVRNNEYTTILINDPKSYSVFNFENERSKLMLYKYKQSLDDFNNSYGVSYLIYQTPDKIYQQLLQRLFPSIHTQEHSQEHAQEHSQEHAQEFQAQEFCHIYYLKYYCEVNDANELLFSNIIKYYNGNIKKLLVGNVNFLFLLFKIQDFKFIKNINTSLTDMSFFIKVSNVLFKYEKKHEENEELFSYNKEVQLLKGICATSTNDNGNFQIPFCSYRPLFCLSHINISKHFGNKIFKEKLVVVAYDYLYAIKSSPSVAFYLRHLSEWLFMILLLHDNDKDVLQIKNNLKKIYGNEHDSLETIIRNMYFDLIKKHVFVFCTSMIIDEIPDDVINKIIDNFFFYNSTIPIEFSSIKIAFQPNTNDIKSLMDYFYIILKYEELHTNKTTINLINETLTDDISYFIPYTCIPLDFIEKYQITKTDEEEEEEEGEGEGEEGEREEEVNDEDVLG